MPCKLKNGKITMCKGLDAVIEMGGQGTRLQGVKLQSLINVNTGKFSRNLVIIKSGDHRKTGIVANYCPFCRAEIYQAMPAKKKRKAA